MMGGDKVLVIGSGGREHCLSWKLTQSQEVGEVFVAPGNGGTSQETDVVNVELKVDDFSAVSSWCKENFIDLVVVGPEDPLAKGIVDHLTNEGIACFGPSANAAQLESSKQFAKTFMQKHNIPTAQWASFSDVTAAQNFIEQAQYSALVVKASGLAAGKGVKLCSSKQEACQVVKEMIQGGSLGAAGQTVVIEELLQGPEISCLCFSDGSDILCFPAAQDHKRLLEDNMGPNTGGMGAYSPCPLISPLDMNLIKEGILQRSIDCMKQDGVPYVGVLYAGLMLTSDGPKVLEFNCRFGDPETQVLLPLMDCDLYSIMKACVVGSLGTCSMSVDTGSYAVATVLVSEGYPAKYGKGKTITGLEKMEEELKVHVFHAGTKQNDGTVVTNGGRVLAVVAKDTDLSVAVQRSQVGASLIEFEGKQYRKDIAQEALLRLTSLTYADSGVDITAGDSLVESIKPAARETSRHGCISELGGFGSVFDVKAAGYKAPLLVSGTDGVGTKLKVAEIYKQHHTIGQDLVAMCANDILCHGAEPLYFLDYFACGKLDVNVAKEVVEGIAKACKEAGCALSGGETAEMPGMYNPGVYDLAGFAVGAVERDHYLPKLDQIQAGDVVIGLASSGLHSNGFSLVRRLVDHCQFTYDMTCPWDETRKLGDALLTPTRLYVKSALPLLQSDVVKAMAHITGGGLPGNLPRILPKGLGVKLDANQWQVQPVFSWIADKGNVSGSEMARTFNLGVGAVIITSPENKDQVVSQLKEKGDLVFSIGSVCHHGEGSERVIIENLDSALKRRHQKHGADASCAETSDKRQRMKDDGVVKKRVGVLISGTGTNLQALIDHTHNPANASSAEIALVISNKKDAQGLKRAQAAGIPSLVVSHKDYSSREEFDDAVTQALDGAGVDIVCLAGFMRILSGKFVRYWHGRLLNVHPSLLPSFKGMNAHEQVLEAGVRVTGCTVHFVVEEIDAGAILAQETVPVLPGDTKEVLQERVKVKEHVAFPKALELLASGQAYLGEDGKVVWR